MKCAILTSEMWFQYFSSFAWKPPLFKWGRRGGSIASITDISTGCNHSPKSKNCLLSDSLSLENTTKMTWEVSVQRKVNSPKWNHLSLNTTNDNTDIECVFPKRSYKTRANNAFEKNRFANASLKSRNSKNEDLIHDASLRFNVWMCFTLIFIHVFFFFL